MRSSSGFTFSEFVAVVAIIVALAGVITPFASRDLDSTQLEQARTEVNRIASGIVRYIADTRLTPTGPLGKKQFHVLTTAGETPIGNTLTSGAVGTLSDFLIANSFETKDWRGPYLEKLGADPWGTQFIVNVEGYFNTDERVWVICAGPNRTIDTPVDSFESMGDDIAVLLQ